MHSHHAPPSLLDFHMSFLVLESYFSHAAIILCSASRCFIILFVDCNCAAISDRPPRNSRFIHSVCLKMGSDFTCSVVRSAQSLVPSPFSNGTRYLAACSCSHKRLTSICLTFERPRRSMIPPPHWHPCEGAMSTSHQSPQQVLNNLKLRMLFAQCRTIPTQHLI